MSGYTKTHESAISFLSDGSELYGVIHKPVRGFHRGILILGGRLGCNRQSVLLARFWAEHGIPVMRFDCRGMGDSDGKSETLEENFTDIRNAINTFASNTPRLKEVVLWGLCDWATTALLYSLTDQRITGLVMVNPGMDVEHARPSDYMRYYSGRITNINFWSKIARGDFDFIGAALTFFNRFTNAFKIVKSNNDNQYRFLSDRLAKSLNSFGEALLLILSGEDINAHIFASTFQHWMNTSATRLVTVYHVPEANHVFSRREWRDQMASKTMEWIKVF